MMLMFNNSDIKNGNNTLCEHRSDNGIEHWYVVRDLGGALGSTGRLAPLKNDPDAFAPPVRSGHRERPSRFSTADGTRSSCASGSPRPIWRGPAACSTG